MSNNQQSFYEIQLNTHHLLFAFIGALVVGVAVFYLGVVVGRGQGSGQVAEEWQAATLAGESEEDGLDFYESVQQPTAQSEEAPAAVQDPGAGEPIAGPETQSTPPPPAEAQALPVEVESTSASMPESDPGLVSGWVIQVKSTTDKPAADALQAALAREGFPAFVVSAEVRDQTWHRVRVGRYRERADAEVVAGRLGQRTDVESTWVTEG